MILSSPVRTLPSIVVKPMLRLARVATGYDSVQSMADIEQYTSVVHFFGEQC